MRLHFLDAVKPRRMDDTVIDRFTGHDSEASLSSTKLVECRICHDADVLSNMDSPCSCAGSLKYVHHSCLQRWCNHKGDTTCEICSQQYKPGYTAPGRIDGSSRLPQNFRRNGGTPLRYLNDNVIPVVAGLFLDIYFGENASSAATLMDRIYLFIIKFTSLVLVLHIIAIRNSYTWDYYLPPVMLMMSLTVAMLFICIIQKAAAYIPTHRYQQVGVSITSWLSNHSSSMMTTILLAFDQLLVDRDDTDL